jgi:hypothetical protein
VFNGDDIMTPRWLACVVVGLATQTVYAQTEPVAAQDYEEADQQIDAGPVAPNAPPELPQERPTARPYAGAVWTAGHWYWDGSQWRFKQGAWIAPMSGYQFINGYWQQGPGGWQWVSGGWARGGSNVVEIPVEPVDEDVSTTQAPPPVQNEVQPPQPAANVTWAPGYWYWSGANWIWIEGSWVSPPRPGLTYVSPRWVLRGGSWLFVSGGWALPGSLHVVVPIYRHAGIAVTWGHPNYFLYSWHRYPMVHRYYNYGARPHYYSGGRPYYNPGERYHGGWGHREPAPSNYHPATPVHEHGGGGGGHRHH